MLGSIAQKGEGGQPGSAPGLIWDKSWEESLSPPTHLGSPFILYRIGSLFSGTSEFHPLG